MHAHEIEVLLVDAVGSTIIRVMSSWFHNPSPGPRAAHAEPISWGGLAAIVAVLQLAVLARRLSVRHAPRQDTLLSWQSPDATQLEERCSEDRTPSKPVQTYCAGQLELTFGMAIVALGQWLHIMRLNGVRAN